MMFHFNFDPRLKLLSVIDCLCWRPEYLFSFSQYWFLKAQYQLSNYSFSTIMITFLQLLISSAAMPMNSTLLSNRSKVQAHNSINIPNARAFCSPNYILLLIKFIKEFIPLAFSISQRTRFKNKTFFANIYAFNLFKMEILHKNLYVYCFALSEV